MRGIMRVIKHGEKRTEAVIVMDIADCVPDPTLIRLARLL